jgi:asparaginyl-tRNA synthetase
VANHDFARISYTEAVQILTESGKEFSFPVSWGSDLQSEHERFLAEEVFRKPVIVLDYPAALKPFYMRENEDGRTVAAMDILLPGIGEIVGGSQREERYEVLERRMLAAGLDLDTYRWYLDLRRYGSVPHAGFGVGFERLVQFVTGLANIRETIPFPRTPGHAEF